MLKRGFGFWLLQGPGWLLLIYLIYAQGIPAFDYQLGVTMGTQESAAQITEVGASFFWGFAFADLVIYIPLLTAGLIGHWLAKTWGQVMLAAALGITAYWPIVSLATVVAAKDVNGWNLSAEADYWAVLPVIVLWAVYGFWFILKQR
jgi:hypothetical protein